MGEYQKIGRRPLVVGIGGTTRPGSGTERALLESLNAAAMAGADTIAICGEALLLPLYRPDQSDRTPEARFLVEAIRKADGIIVASPSYHGGVSGLVKNALDYVEDLQGDSRVYLDGRAVGCIACGAGWNATGQTLGGMRAIVHALRGWPTPLGVVVNTSAAQADHGGNTDEQLRIVGRQVVAFANAMRSASLSFAAADGDSALS